MIGDPRLEPLVIVRLAEPAGVRELQADEQVVERAERLAVGRLQFVEQRGQAGAVRGVASVWFGLARPSGRTAAASPPQISFAPLSPKFRHRRSVCSDGEPSVLASQPSIGWMHQRLPTSKPPIAIGCASGEPSAADEHFIVDRQRKPQLRQPPANAAGRRGVGRSSGNWVRRT